GRLGLSNREREAGTRHGSLRYPDGLAIPVFLLPRSVHTTRPSERVAFKLLLTIAAFCASSRLRLGTRVGGKGWPSWPSWGKIAGRLFVSSMPSSNCEGPPKMATGGHLGGLVGHLGGLVGHLGGLVGHLGPCWLPTGRLHRPLPAQWVVMYWSF